MDQNFNTVEEWKAAGSPVGDATNTVTIGGSTATIPPEPPTQSPPAQELEGPPPLTSTQQAELAAAAQVAAGERARAIEAGTLHPEILGPVSAPAGSIEGPGGTMITPAGGVILTPGSKPVYPEGANVIFNPMGSTETVGAPATTAQPVSADTQVKQDLITKIEGQGGLFKADQDTARKAIELGLYRDASGVPLTYTDYQKGITQSQKSDLASTLLPEIQALGGVDSAIKAGQIDKVRQAVYAGLYTVKDAQGNDRQMTQIDLLDRQLAVADEGTRDFALNTLRTQAPGSITHDNQIYIERALASGVDPSILRLLNLPQDKIDAAQQSIITPKIEQGIANGRIADTQAASSLLGTVSMGPAQPEQGGIIGLLSFGDRKALFGQEGPLKNLIAPAQIGDGRYGYLGSTGVIPIVRENIGAPILGNLVSTEAAREAGFNVSPLQWTGSAIATALQILPFAVKLPSGAVVIKFAPGTAIEDIALGRATGVPVRGIGEISTLEGKLINIPADVSGGEQFASGLARSKIQDLPIFWEKGSPSYIVRGESGQPFKIPVSSIESFGKNLGKVQFEESGGVYKPSYYIGNEKIPIGGGGGIQPAVSPELTPLSPSGIATKITRGETLTQPETQFTATNPEIVNQEIQRIRLGSALVAPVEVPTRMVPMTAPAPVSIPSPETKEQPVAIPIPPVTPVIISPIAPVAPSISIQPIPGLIGVPEPTGATQGVSVSETPTIEPVRIGQAAEKPTETTTPTITPALPTLGETVTPTEPPLEPGVTPKEPKIPPPVLAGSGSIYRSGDITGETIITNLSGQVRDSLTNQPIVKVLVRAINSAGAKSQRLTDKNGRYQFTDINPDYYTVISTKEGYDPIQVRKLVNQGENRLDFKPRQIGITTVVGGQPSPSQTLIAPPAPSAPALRTIQRVIPIQPGVIALKQGDSGFYTVIYPPYQPNNIVHMKVPPPDALILPNIGSAYKTIVSMGGNGNVLLNEYQMDKQYSRPKIKQGKSRKKVKRQSSQRAIMLRGTFKIERLK